MSGAFKKDWVYWMAGWLAMCLLLLAFSLSLPYLSSPFLFHLAPFPSLSHISPPSSISVQLAGHNRRIQDFSHFLMDPGGVERPTNSLSLSLSLFKNTISSINYSGKESWQARFGSSFSSFFSWVPLTRHVIVLLSILGSRGDNEKLRGEEWHPNDGPLTVGNLSTCH